MEHIIRSTHFFLCSEHSNTNDLHMWGMAEQFFLSAASLYVCVLFGQNGTIDIVGVDALQGILKSRIT